MLVTICKSCTTISRSLKDRCYYCGSKMVEFKSINPEFIKKMEKTREILSEYEQPETKSGIILK